MKNTFYIVSIIVGVSIIVLLIWNIVLYNKRINRRSRSDEKYYELKYQQQFYTAIFATIIAVLSFFGYDKYSEVESTIKNDVSKQTENILNKSKADFQTKIREIEGVQSQIIFQYENLKETNNNLRDNSQRTNDRFYELLNQFISLKKDLVYSEIELQSQVNSIQSTNKSIESLKNDITGFKKIDFLNQVYLVTNQYFKGNLQTLIDTVYYKNLKSINGNELPQFKSQPSLIVSRTSGADVDLIAVEKDYFVIGVAGFQMYKPEDENPTNWKYDVLIIYKEFQ